MSCNEVFLREPVEQDLEAMGNVMLPISINEWADSTQQTPLDLTGYTARGALKNRSLLTDVHALTVVITQTSSLCNITGTLDKASVEGLIMENPYYYDLSVDNSVTGDSFVLIRGTIIFHLGASS